MQIGLPVLRGPAVLRRPPERRLLLLSGVRLGRGVPFRYGVQIPIRHVQRSAYRQVRLRAQSRGNLLVPDKGWNQRVVE